MAHLTPNYPKTIEALLFLMELAGSDYMTQYPLVKALFVADTNHLNIYGRPITFCNYVAMENGPVPSEAYNILKDQLPKNLKISDFPWQTQNSGGKKLKFIPSRSANRNLLSVSDLKMLKDGYAFVSARNFSETRDETHKNPAYIEAWNRRNGKDSVNMKLEILANHDVDLVSDLVHASKYAVTY
jgi:uncharacterized phage-associated protein